MLKVKNEERKKKKHTNKVSIVPYEQKKTKYIFCNKPQNEFKLQNQFDC